MYIVHIFRERESSYIYDIQLMIGSKLYIEKYIHIYTYLYIYICIFFEYSVIYSLLAVWFLFNALIVVLPSILTHRTHETHRFDEADVMSVVCAAVACFRRSGHKRVTGKMTTGGFSKCFLLEAMRQ